MSQQLRTIDIRLAEAVAAGRIALVEKLLEDGAHLDGSEAHRPLITAVFNRRRAVAKLLIEKGADVNAGCTIPESDRARHPLRHLGAPYNGQVPFRGETPLHAAACDQITTIVPLLLAAGANPNAKTNEGATPLIGMAVEWCASNAEALLEAGADPLEPDLDGYTALNHAAAFGTTDAVRWLASIAPSTINALTVQGRSPLYSAARGGHAETVSYLLAAGARHPLTATQECCPLGAAVVMGNVEVVRVMVAEGGLDAIGGAPAVMPLAVCGAITYGASRMLWVLLNCTGEEDRTRWIDAGRAMAGPVLHYAAGYIVPGPVSVLLQAGADATATDGAGQRAIDVIGTMDRNNPPLGPLHPRVPTRFRDPVKEAEIRRTLLRAPAFRARSWSWPVSAVAEPASSAGVPGRGRATAAAGVRVYRPAAGRRICLAGPLWRYPRKCS
eukprot:g15440.t1